MAGNVRSLDRDEFLRDEFLHDLLDHVWRGRRVTPRQNLRTTRFQRGRCVRADLDHEDRVRTVINGKLHGLRPGSTHRGCGTIARNGYFLDFIIFYGHEGEKHGPAEPEVHFTGQAIACRRRNRNFCHLSRPRSIPCSSLDPGCVSPVPQGSP